VPETLSEVHEMAATTIPKTDIDVGRPDIAEKDIENGQAANSASSDAEDGNTSDIPEARSEQTPWDWNHDPHNPYNWSSGRKAMQVVIIASIAFLA